MRKIAVVSLLLVGIQAMAQASFGQKPNILKATQDSIIASFADKGKQLAMMTGQWGGVNNDTTSYFMKSVTMYKSVLRISQQEMRRYLHNTKNLPSARPLFENEQLKRLKQADQFWFNDRNTWTGVGNNLLEIIFK